MYSPGFCYWVLILCSPLHMTTERGRGGRGEGGKKRKGEGGGGGGRESVGERVRNRKFRAVLLSR